jgi:hypothetical protein
MKYNQKLRPLMKITRSFQFLLLFVIIISYDIIVVNIDNIFFEEASLQQKKIVTTMKLPLMITN